MLLILIQPGCAEQPKNEASISNIITDITNSQTNNAKAYETIVNSERENFKKYISSNIVSKRNSNHIIDYSNIEILRPYLRTINEFKLKSKLSTGEIIEVYIQTKHFNKKNRVIKYLDYGPVDSIDGQYAYYGDSIPKYPLYETEFITVKIDGRKLDLNKRYYSNYFDIHITENKQVWDLGMNIIYDKSSGLFHLVFSGGSVSGTYWAKLIFDKNKFIKTYVLDYGELSEHGSFYRKFIGF